MKHLSDLKAFTEYAQCMDDLQQKRATRYSY